MENAIASNISVSPARLYFPPPLNRPMRNNLSISNQSSNVLYAFRIRTTAPNSYCVRPFAGVITPGDSTIVTIIYTPDATQQQLAEPDASHKDRFQILFVPVTPEQCQSIEDVQQVWSQYPSGTHKVSVVSYFKAPKLGEQGPTEVSPEMLAELDINYAYGASATTSSANVNPASAPATNATTVPPSIVVDTAAASHQYPVHATTAPTAASVAAARSAQQTNFANNAAGSYQQATQPSHPTSGTTTTTGPAFPGVTVTATSEGQSSIYLPAFSQQSTSMRDNAVLFEEKQKLRRQCEELMKLLRDEKVKREKAEVQLQSLHLTMSSSTKPPQSGYSQFIPFILIALLSFIIGRFF